MGSCSTRRPVESFMEVLELNVAIVYVGSLQPDS